MFMRRPRRSILRRLRIGLIPLFGQAAGLAVLVAVLAAALVSAPLMVASAEQGAWEQEQDRLSPRTLGTTLNSSTLAQRQSSSTGRVARAAELDAAVDEAAEAVGLPAPVAAGVFRDPLPIGPATGPVAQGQILFRDGAEDNVEITAGTADGSGVLVPVEVAEAGRLAPGDSLTVFPERGGPQTLPVSGVYVTPTAPVDPYWDGLGALFLPMYSATGDLVYPPPVLIAPSDVAFATGAATFEDLFLEWFFPLDRSVPVDGARATVADVERLQAYMATPESAISRLIAAEAYQRPTPRSALTDTLARVDRTVDLLEPPVRAVGVGGGLAALVLIGAWAGQRMRRREDEVRSLVARGLSPARGAGDAAREALVPVLAGLAAGGAAGWLLVREFGPSPTFPPGALTSSLVVLALGGLAALAAVAVVSAVLITRLDAIGRGQVGHLLRRIPWLPVVAVVTVVAVAPLVLAEPDPDGGSVDVLTLMVPLLITVTAAGAVTAALPWLGRHLDRPVRRLRPGTFLAIRRVFAAQGAARLVVVTTALSLGLVIYADALADSTNRTIEAKATVATGSDVVVPLARVRALGGELPEGAMVVGTDNDSTVVPGDVAANVLVVQPEQVPDVVRWSDELADRPLEELMAALADYEGDRVPVILSGPFAQNALDGADGELTIDFGYYTMPVDVVGRAEAFPGQTSREPLLVADWDRYIAAIEGANRDPDLVLGREVWARGELGPTVDTLSAAGYTASSPDGISSAAEFASRPELHAQGWSLDYLRAVALAAGVLGLVGLTMQAVAQQRRRTVAALLVRRMGMSRRAAEASSGLEIGLLAGLAALVAIAVALPSSALVLRLLDPVPSLQPEPLFAVPWGSIAAVVAGVVLVTVGGAMLVGRTARRATGGQVMRDAA
jgi:putative ABC transport system permease protein